MLIPNKYNGYIHGRRLYNVDAGIGEAALLSAMIGGGSAAVSGGDPLKGALLGGLTGGLGNMAAPMIGQLFGAAAPTLTEGLKLGAEVAPELGTAATVATDTATNFANLGNLGVAPTQAATDLGFQAQGQALQRAALANAPTSVIPTVPEAGLSASEFFKAPTGGITNLATDTAARSAAIPSNLQAISNPAAAVPRVSLFDDPMAYLKGHKLPALAAGLTGLSTVRQNTAPEQEKYTGPLSRFRFNPETYKPTMYAEGGITTLASGGYDQQVGEEPMNMPMMAGGGIATLGGYSDGGRMLKGPGDGMSDSIPASIAGKQPARLARDEFVVPADVVSHLGNGSSDAGAKQLYAMMDRIRQARTGTKKQGREIKPTKFMPA